MLYKYENDVLEEYEVKINFELLKKVRLQIIENCSFIKKKTAIGTSAWFIRNEKIKNVELGKSIGKEEYNDGPDKMIYEYSYDEYFYPNIIEIIDDILLGNENRIQDLFESEDLEKNLNIYREIDKLNQVIELLKIYINNNDKNNLTYAQTLLKSYKHEPIIQPKKSVKDYYRELQNCFNFKKNNIQTIQQVNFIKEKYGSNWEETLKQILNFENNAKNSINNESIKKLMR